MTTKRKPVVLTEIEASMVLSNYDDHVHELSVSTLFEAAAPGPRTWLLFDLALTCDGYLSLDDLAACIQVRPRSKR